ncbi:GHKL domain-containing protein, partial [candidate division KSB1 bacterium]|nr:GHKL domain-containing protein [candidate division KSB1 bacterium]
LSTPLGEAFAALHMKFDSAPFIHAAVEHWRQQQVYREEWNREQFIAWTQSILKQGLIDSPEKYQAGGEAPEKLVLQFMPFTQGMLYIGSSAALSDDEIAIGRALANAFGVAYARYEDFQRLETAKAQVEAALDNLKKTQGQLVQAEKMASLGQLTAGIAHEIKNPLNFVNNFAALSVDLAKELREEIAKIEDGGLKMEDSGSRMVDRENFANIDDIVETLIQNAEKINHHGKRADGIVKSMMQHARGSSGQRELADINQLLDEAVNLTYHGLRANDASFNITIEKEYDETIGKLEVVPQDISRVFLNIMNNACYAAFQKQKANEKEKKASSDSFSPAISVSTKNLRDRIEIRIRDNGNGIPKDIREKIFNPFFTTKPTGQGTGLGLSISYDIIVQQHRGEIAVETEEGEFTEFVVRLTRV